MGISLMELVRRCSAATSPTLQYSVKSKHIVAGDRLILSSNIKSNVPACCIVVDIIVLRQRLFCTQAVISFFCRSILLVKFSYNWKCTFIHMKY